MKKPIHGRYSCTATSPDSFRFAQYINIEKMKEARKALGFTQEELSIKIGMGLHYIANLEEGIINPPPRCIHYRLIDILGETIVERRPIKQ